MEINFYQVDDILYKSIVPLLIKILDENKKASILCQDDQQVTEIDNGLWSFSKTKFLPHGTMVDKLDHSNLPIFITKNEENLNQASYLIMLNSAGEQFLQQFDKIFYFFGSGDVKNARKLWANYKKQSFILNFYTKVDGIWAKVDL